MTTGFDHSCGLLKARENSIVKWFEWARGQWQCYLKVCKVPYFQFLFSSHGTLCKKGDMQSEERKETVQITFLIQTSEGVKSPWAPVTEVSVL